VPFPETSCNRKLYSDRLHPLHGSILNYHASVVLHKAGASTAKTDSNMKWEEASASSLQPLSEVILA
jgi:hypothetical protein